jgi:hypothetical protein
MKRAALALLLAVGWPYHLAAQTGRDTTIYTATRVITSATGKITSVSVAKVATLPSGRVDTVRVTRVDTVRGPAWTQYFYWHPRVFGNTVLFPIASMNNDPTPPASITLPAVRPDTVIVRVPVPGPVVHDTVYVPRPIPVPTPTGAVELPRVFLETRMPPTPAPGGVVITVGPP